MGNWIVELVWLIAGVITIGFAGYHMPTLHREWLEAKGETAKLLCWSYLRREIERLIIGVLFFIVGLYAVFVQPDLPGKELTYVGLVCLGGVAAVVSFSSWKDWHTRQRLERMVNSKS